MIELEKPKWSQLISAMTGVMVNLFGSRLKGATALLSATASQSIAVLTAGRSSNQR